MTDNPQPSADAERLADDPAIRDWFKEAVDACGIHHTGLYGKIVRTGLYGKIVRQLTRLREERDAAIIRAEIEHEESKQQESHVKRFEFKLANALHEVKALEAEVGRLRDQLVGERVAGFRLAEHELTYHARKDSTGDEAKMAFHIAANWLASRAETLGAAPPAADHTEQAREILLSVDHEFVYRQIAAALAAAERAGREDERSLRVELVRNELRALRTERDNALAIAREEVRAETFSADHTKRAREILAPFWEWHSSTGKIDLEKAIAAGLAAAERAGAEKMQALAARVAANVKYDKRAETGSFAYAADIASGRINMLSLDDALAARDADLTAAGASAATLTGRTEAQRQR